MTFGKASIGDTCTSCDGEIDTRLSAGKLQGQSNPFMAGRYQSQSRNDMFCEELKRASILRYRAETQGRKWSSNCDWNRTWASRKEQSRRSLVTVALVSDVLSVTIAAAPSNDTILTMRFALRHISLFGCCNKCWRLGICVCR